MRLPVRSFAWGIRFVSPNSTRRFAALLCFAAMMLSGAAFGQSRETLGEGDSIRITVFQNPDRKSTRLNSSHSSISYAVFCLKKKKKKKKKQKHTNKLT